MKVWVCVKTVPDDDSVDFDTQKGTLRRTGKGMVANPCDMVAAEAGIEFIREYGGCLSAVSMGPSDAGLKSVLAMGVEKAYLLRSNWFAGADVPATAYTLSTFFQKYSDFDVILCGKHSADGDTGQTGAMLAEILGIPYAGGVIRIIQKTEDNKLEVMQRLDDQEIILEIETPCLLVIRNDFCIPSTPTLQGILRARRQEIEIESEETLESLNIELCGAKGSATKVVRIYVPDDSRKAKQILLEETGRLRSILEEMIQNGQ